jgi:hypothetical protein
MPVTSTPLLFAFVMLMMPGAAVVTTMPSSADMVAVLGAMLASAIVVLNFQTKSPNNRRLTQFLPVLLASVGIGSAGPGFVFYTFYPDLAERLTWHGWAISGLGFGLFGWALVYWILNTVLKRVMRKFDGWLTQFLKLPGDKEDEDA